MLRTLLTCLAASGLALHVPKPPLLSHGSKCKSSRSGVRLASPLSGPEGLPLRPPSKLSGVVDDRVAALDRSADAFVEGIMISDVVTIGDTSDAPVIIGEELVENTAQESDNIAIAALLAVAVLWAFAAFCPLCLICNNPWVVLSFLVLERLLHLKMPNLHFLEDWA